MLLRVWSHLQLQFTACETCVVLWEREPEFENLSRRMVCMQMPACEHICAHYKSVYSEVKGGDVFWGRWEGEERGLGRYYGMMHCQLQIY